MGRHKDYDDDALVLALARRDKTLHQIAEEFGLSYQTVWQISKGRARKALHPQIQAAREEVVNETRKMARQMAKAAMGRLGRLIADDVEPTAGVQRKAALDILHLAGVEYAPGEPRAEAPARPKATWETMSRLTLETRRRIAKELGGTEPDE